MTISGELGQCIRLHKSYILEENAGISWNLKASNIAEAGKKENREMLSLSCDRMKLFMSSGKQKRTEEKVCLSEWSEFSDNGYDVAAVCFAIEKAIEDSQSGTYDEIVRLFNQAYRNRMNEFEDGFPKGIKIQHPLTLSKVSALTDCGQNPDLTADKQASNSLKKQRNSNTEENEREESLKNLQSAYDNLVQYVNQNNNLYEEELARNYLDAFLNASRKVVFNPDSFNLGNNLFRQSRLLKELLSFAAKKETTAIANADPDRDILYYNYSLLDPFAYDTLERALHCAALLASEKKKIKKTNDGLLFNLRIEIFLNSIQSAFKRFVCLDRHTYRIELNRHTSKLTALPMAELSSTEEIKPIRLFGKTATYIRNHIVQGTEKCSIHLCIIGHTEKSHSDYEASMTDFAAAVLNWYQFLQINPTTESDHDLEYAQKPNLELIITNYVNDADGPEPNMEDNRQSFRLESASGNGLHTVECRICRVSYEETFSFGMESLEAVIQNNDLIFLLDCPWLSTEDYRIRSTGNLKYYCDELQEKSREIPPCDYRFDQEINAFYERSTMNKLSSQYNRIMNTRTVYSGELLRIMRDDFIMTISNKLLTAKARERNQSGDHLNQGSGSELAKELYIFSSESDGMDYSYISNYPLTREERYDGKCFTIIQFRQNPCDCMEAVMGDEPEFTFDLWAVLKYISVSYAYRGFRDQIKKVLDLSENEPILYFELLRNVLIRIKLSDDLMRIHVGVDFGSNFEKVIKKMRFDQETNQVRQVVWDLTMELIQPLYRDCVFAENQCYGDDAIKKGFQMNLYGAAKDVRGMLFYHWYNMVVSSDQYDAFTLVFDKKFPPEKEKNETTETDDEFLHRDFFMDKKMYTVLMNNLEYSASESPRISSMMSKMEQLYVNWGIIDKEASQIQKSMLEKIRKACEATHSEEMPLYKNTLQALKEF